MFFLAKGDRGFEGEGGTRRAPRGDPAQEDRERGGYSNGTRGVERVVLSYPRSPPPPFFCCFCFFFLCRTVVGGIFSTRLHFRVHPPRTNDDRVRVVGWGIVERDRSSDDTAHTRSDVIPFDLSSGDNYKRVFVGGYCYSCPVRIFTGKTEGTLCSTVRTLMRHRRKPGLTSQMLYLSGPHRGEWGSQMRSPSSLFLIIVVYIGGTSNTSKGGHLARLGHHLAVLSAAWN